MRRPFESRTTDRSQTGRIGRRHLRLGTVMQKLFLALDFEQRTNTIKSTGELETALSDVSLAMGFRYFALMHHVDALKSAGTTLRLHNYPLAFSNWFDENRFGRQDPVHRACHRTTRGFSWTKVPGMIRLRRTDLEIFGRARAEGIGEGFTVPAHVPGESRGSCSFAVGGDDDLPDEWFPVAQLIGVSAFETARRLNLPQEANMDSSSPLTNQQRECVLWIARGKTDAEIAGILGRSRETIRHHVKQARERYGIQKRSELAVRALYDGTISFNDVLDS